MITAAASSSQFAAMYAPASPDGAVAARTADAADQDTDPAPSAAGVAGQATHSADSTAPGTGRSAGDTTAPASGRVGGDGKAAVYERGPRDKAGTGAGGTSPQDAAIIAKLQSRDAHVRAHEAAHMAAGGAYIRGGASYSYERGPDGREYAVGGEVGIDTSPVPNDPQATIRKMETVRAAALAPADPSAADLSVAGAAAAMEAQAWAQLAQHGTQQSSGSSGVAPSAHTSKGSLVNATA